MSRVCECKAKEAGPVRPLYIGGSFFSDRRLFPNGLPTCKRCGGVMFARLAGSSAPTPDLVKTGAAA